MRHKIKLSDVKTDCGSNQLVSILADGTVGSLHVIEGTTWTSKYCNRVISQFLKMRQMKNKQKSIQQYGRALR